MFRRVRKIAKSDCQLRHMRLSVRPRWNNSACPINFSESREIMWKKYYRPGQTADDNMAHALYVLDF
jgi:hypothetical protein